MMVKVHPGLGVKLIPIYNITYFFISIFNKIIIK